MFRTVKNPLKHQSDKLFKYRMRQSARRYIALCPFAAREKKLNEYFIENYEVPLRPVCLALVNEAKFFINYNHELVIKFTNPSLDRLARLITYGNGVIQGSNILNNAFKDKYI